MVNVKHSITSTLSRVPDCFSLESDRASARVLLMAVTWLQVVCIAMLDVSHIALNRATRSSHDVLSALYCIIMSQRVM
jgi:hypothetical protein